jgi:hypothetical protein
VDGRVGLPTRSISQIRESLLSFVRMPSADWQKLSPKYRRNLIVEACDLRSTFAPRVVRETLYEGDDGELRSLCTGRDGRKVWDGPARKAQYRAAGESRFTFVRSLPRFQRYKSDRFSYIVSVLADYQPVLKTVRPLTRLAVQFSQLDTKSFKGIVRAVIASIPTKIEVRHKAEGRIPTRVKPCLLGTEIKSISPMVAIPLWDWRTVRVRLLPRKGNSAC